MDIIQKVRGFGDFKGVSFQELHKKALFNKDILTAYDELARAFPCGLGARDILAAYLFVYHEFGDKVVYDPARSLLQALHGGSATDVHAKMEDYARVYLEWKEKDRKELMQSLCIMYWEYELILALQGGVLDADEREHWMAEKNKCQARIKRELEKLGCLHELPKYQPSIATVSEHIRSMLTRCYWDILREDLKTGVEGIFRILAEVREMVEYMAPSLIEQYDEVMDIAFMREQHAIGAADVTFWLQRCEYLFSVLIELDSAAMEVEHKRWWSALDKTRGWESMVDFLEYFMKWLSDVREIVQMVRNT